MHVSKSGTACMRCAACLITDLLWMLDFVLLVFPVQLRTSGRSTKLIHGGIRYLETAFMKLDYGSYELVKEALEERAYMLNAAPYMNHPLPIMMPIYRWW